MKKEKLPWQLEMDMSEREVSIKEPAEKLSSITYNNIVLEDKKEDETAGLVWTNNFIVIDIETTGIKPESERLTEIVALKYNENFDYMGAVYHNLLNPVKKIPDFVSKLTKITQEMVKYKPYGGKGVKDLVRELNFAKDILVAHNARFEYDWLSHYESIFKTALWIDTRAIYLYMRDGNTWDNNFTKDYSRLKQVCEYYGIEYVEKDAHRAEYDVLKTRLVAEKMIKKIGLKKCLLISSKYVLGEGYGRRKPKEEKVKGSIYD